MLSVFNETGEATKIRREAIELDSGSLTKMLLRFPSQQKIDEIVPNQIWLLWRYETNYEHCCNNP